MTSSWRKTTPSSRKESARRSSPNALAAIAERRPDVLVLDIMMPKTDGITVCRTIRRTDAHLPILMLTARGLDSQKVEGLSAGADDYLPKPFSIAELLARIAALLRRALLAAPESAADTFAFGAATVDASTLTVTASDGTSQRLLPRELRLLKLFAENPGKVFSRDELLDRFWGVSYYGTTRTLDQRLMLLRKKLGSDAARIESVHGVGYKYVPAGGS